MPVLRGYSSEQVISVYQEGMPILEWVGELGLLCLFSTGLASNIDELVDELIKVRAKAAIVATIGVVPLYWRHLGCS